MYLLIRLSVKGAGAPVRRSKRAPAFPPPVEGCAALLRSEFFALRPKKRRPLSEYLFLLYGQPCRIARRKSSRYSQFVCGEIAFAVRLFCAAGGACAAGVPDETPAALPCNLFECCLAWWKTGCTEAVRGRLSLRRAYRRSAPKHVCPRRRGDSASPPIHRSDAGRRRVLHNSHRQRRH